MAKDKFVTLSLLKKYDALKTPPIQYVESLPTENVENGIYAVKHEGTETKTVDTRFTDILYSYFTEESKGKWTINEGYTLVIEGNTFKSVALVSDKYYIYANPDYTEMYAYSYSPQSTYEFTVLEDISHTDFYAGKAEDNSFVKLANVDEVERYFIRVEEKGASNGVASLDVNGKVPIEQLPTEALVFKGYWKPSSGSYPPDGTVAGDFYIVEEEGDFDNIHWNVNDWLIWDGTKWTRSENHNDVTSVNGKKGAVKVYGDNTEITETSDTRTIKEYIDAITVDGAVKDENDNYTSKAVIDVTELPETLNDKVYIKSDKTVYAKDTKLVTEAENKNNIKSVNNETPDENGAVVLDGDNINVQVEENAETLNTVLNRFNDEFGKTKTVDGNVPDENGNTISKAVIDITELPETVDDKVYIKTDKTVYAKDTKLVTQDEFDKDAVKTVNTIKPTDGNVQTVVPITKAEYKALVDANKDDPNVVYAVYDEQSSVDIINDFQIAENLTWSSSKIQSVITAATPIVFDDSKVSNTMGWTSEKIKNEIAAKSSIDDTATSTTSSWSSNKTSTEIATATTDMATQTWASNTFEPKNADILTKTTADALYQPTGDYATKTDVSTATNDMATQTWSSNTFEPANADLLTKTSADSLYEPKNDDLATKTWVGQQGYLTEHQSLDECVKHSEVYVQNGILYINL